MQPFKLRPADGQQWFHANIKCQAACPVGTEAFAYVSALAMANMRRPMRLPGGRIRSLYLRSGLRHPASRRAAGVTSTSRFRSAPEAHGNRHHDLGLGHAPGLEQLPSATSRLP